MVYRRGHLRAFQHFWRKLYYVLCRKRCVEGPITRQTKDDSSIFVFLSMYLHNSCSNCCCYFFLFSLLRSFACLLFVCVALCYLCTVCCIIRIVRLLSSSFAFRLWLLFFLIAAFVILCFHLSAILCVHCVIHLGFSIAAWIWVWNSDIFTCALWVCC